MATPIDEDRERRRIERLVAWFQRYRRDLPWRRIRTGYTALVAEAMLQQTQVSRVVERFDAFMARFPTIEDLAAADEQDVLACWSGLGYYRRARHLHAAARRVVDRLGGVVPADAASLRQLPGVGAYTAGAIASIVHGHAEPIVDGNVQRVLARWHADDRPPQDRVTRAETWQRAEALVRVAPSPGMLNEALMELGALVCTPRGPRCETCPVSDDCAAHRHGRADEIPPVRRPASVRTVHHHAVLVTRRGCVLVEQRPRDGLWSGLWQPPAIEAEQPLTASAVRGRLADRGLRLSRVEQRDQLECKTTHRRIRFHVFTAITRARRGRWHPIDALDELPMSTAHRRVIERAS